MAAEKKTPGKAVTVEEINYLLTKIRDLRAELESNKRHLNMIEDRLGRLEETVEGLHLDDVVVHDEVVEV